MNPIIGKIKVVVKNVYGNETIYPECETAQLFAQLTGNKTLTRNACVLISKLGYEIEVVLPSRVLK